jgi:hypothetical protein
MDLLCQPYFLMLTEFDEKQSGLISMIDANRGRYGILLIIDLWENNGLGFLPQPQ